jgi:hypothetical protein
MESHEHEREQDFENSQYFETRYVACPGPDETQIVEEPGVSLSCFSYHIFRSHLAYFDSNKHSCVIL